MVSRVGFDIAVVLSMCKHETSCLIQSLISKRVLKNNFSTLRPLTTGRFNNVPQVWRREVVEHLEGQEYPDVSTDEEGKN